jgi:hypothetical protein
MSINMTVQSGVVKSPALRYDSQSRPEFRFTLVQETEKDWPLYLPCFSPGAAGERLASELEDGMAIIITSGRLSYRKRSTKAGEVSRLEILVWAADTISPQEPADRSTSGVGAAPQEIVAPGGSGEATVPKKGRPRYPKHLQDTWTPN